MPARRRTLFAALACLAPAVVAWRAATLTMQPESKLWVDGTSTVRSWSCKATTFDAAIDAAAGAATAVLNAEKAVKTVTVTVPAEKLECGNGTMNEHMRKALKAKDNPTITFTLSSYDVAKGAAGVTGTLNGTLNLGGTQKPVSIKAIGAEGPGGTLRVTGTTSLKMTEYGLKPPTLMLGTLKVGDEVKVSFDLNLKG